MCKQHNRISQVSSQAITAGFRSPPLPDPFSPFPSGNSHTPYSTRTSDSATISIVDVTIDAGTACKPTKQQRMSKPDLVDVDRKQVRESADIKPDEESPHQGPYRLSKRLSNCASPVQVGFEPWLTAVLAAGVQRLPLLDLGRHCVSDCPGERGMYEALGFLSSISDCCGCASLTLEKKPLP